MRLDKVTAHGWLLLLITAVGCGTAAGQNASAPATGSPEQQKAVADLMRQHSYRIDLRDGKLAGPGADFLLQRAAKSQFVIFGEEHGVREFPKFLTALFRALHQQDGFNHLAIESDPVSAHVASIAPLRGNADALATYARKYPNAFTFPTDQELRMIADIGKISTGRTDAVWGLDQSFGVLHALDRIRSLPGFRPTEAFSALHSEAVKSDSTRLTDDSTHFMENVKPGDLEHLRDELQPAPGSETAFILDNLISSAQIYGYYRAAQYYDNGYVREEQMKQLFLRQYRLARSAGENEPKVIAKLGHWHTFRGVGPSHLQTLGDFLTEFATANGNDSITIGVYLRGAWRDVATQKGLEAIAAATDPAAWTIIDFRSMRSQLSSARLGKLDPNLANHIYGFDAALVIGGATPGTTTEIDNPTH